MGLKEFWVRGEQREKYMNEIQRVTGKIWETEVVAEGKKEIRMEFHDCQNNKLPSTLKKKSNNIFMILMP